MLVAMLPSSWWHELVLVPSALAFNNFFGIHHADDHRRRNLHLVPQLHQHQLHQNGESSTTIITDTESKKPTPTTYTFVSPTYNVYIEDTDAYGVMYNGNYIRSYERALSHFPRHKDDSCSWLVSSVTNQKFRSSPVLGEEYVIRGILLVELDEREGQGDEGACQRDQNHMEEVWQLEMATRNRKNTANNWDTEDDDNDWVVHNSATVTILNTLHHSLSLSEKMTEKETASDITPSKEQNITGGGTIFEQRCTAYNDEFDIHHFNLRHQQQQQSSSYRPHSILPIRNAMNFFERSRTNYLGGPSTLRKMQVEEDILWVVTSVDAGRVILMVDNNVNCVENDVEGGNTTTKQAEDSTYLSHAIVSSTTPSPRRDVIVRTNFIVKRRGMIVECRHELFMLDDYDESSQSLTRSNVGRNLLAKATVTVMALNGSTRRPTSKLPQWILDQIMGTAALN